MTRKRPSPLENPDLWLCLLNLELGGMGIGIDLDDQGNPIYLDENKDFIGEEEFYTTYCKGKVEHLGNRLNEIVNMYGIDKSW